MINEIVGQKFGKLKVLTYMGVLEKSKQKTYLCECECGNKKIIAKSNLNYKKTKSCGCESRKNFFTSEKVKKHGQSGTKTYAIWAGIKKRCSEKSTGKSRRLYFDKGIRVCERWQKFENFLEDMGEKPEGKSIDRIDSNGHYEPSNCRWATPKEQANNMSSNNIVEYNGKRQTVSEWAHELNIKANTLTYRLRRAFTPELHNQK
jgi:hypothetical protein